MGDVATAKQCLHTRKQTSTPPIHAQTSPVLLLIAANSRACADTFCLGTHHILSCMSVQDMVDPTGRTFRLDASKLTTIKTARFGLGRATADSLAAIAQKKVHKKVKPHHRLLLKDKISSEKAGSTSRNRGGGSGDGDTVSAAAVYGKAMAAMFNSEPVGELGGENAMSGPAARSTKDPDTTGGGPLQTRKLSVFEQKAMARALERQRTNIVQKQVVWGKEFKGRAFLSQPAVVHFKDFVVGTKMKLTFRLTNVSNTFNNFRLNDLPDTIKDFFTIKYTRPGRMSAGMECAIHIFFKPKIAKDIEVRGSNRV